MKTQTEPKVKSATKAKPPFPSVKKSKDKPAPLFDADKAISALKEEEVTPTEDHRSQPRRASDVMAFCLEQLVAPAALTIAAPAKNLAAPPQALEKFNQELEALKEKFNIPKTAAVIKKSVREKITQNGITRPNANNKCGLIWAEADRITNETGKSCTVQSLKTDIALAGVNDHTLKTQYARWRQFNGIHGRVVNAQVEKGPTVLVFGDIEPF